MALDVPQPGESFLCFGRMPAAAAFVYDGIEHANDLNVCHYAATKGMIRFQMNADDLWLLARDYLEALAVADPQALAEWGVPQPRPE